MLLCISCFRPDFVSHAINSFRHDYRATSTLSIYSGMNTAWHRQYISPINLHAYPPLSSEGPAMGPNETRLHFLRQAIAPPKVLIFVLSLTNNPPGHRLAQQRRWLNRPRHQIANTLKASHPLKVVVSATDLSVVSQCIRLVSHCQANSDTFVITTEKMRRMHHHYFY